MSNFKLKYDDSENIKADCVNHPFSVKGNISSEKISEKLCRQTKNLVPYLYLIDKKDLISRIFSAGKLRFIDYANYIDG